jgi:putative tricarboxylic transport membrane protein
MYSLVKSGDRELRRLCFRHNNYGRTSQCGPLLFSSRPEFCYGIFTTYIIANIIQFIVFALGIPLLIKILQVPKRLLVPIIFIFCVVGSYGINNRIFDVWILLIIGIFAYLLRI